MLKAAEIIIISLLLSITSIAMAGNLFWVDLDKLEGTSYLSGPHVAFVERTSDNFTTRCTLYIINSAGYSSMSVYTDTDNDGELDVAELWAGRAFLANRRYRYPVKSYFVVQSGMPNSMARRDYQTLLQVTKKATEDEIWEKVRNLLVKPLESRN